MALGDGASGGRVAHKVQQFYRLYVCTHKFTYPQAHTLAKATSDIADKGCVGAKAQKKENENRKLKMS